MSINITIPELNIRDHYDQEIAQIADYIVNYQIKSEEAFNTARFNLMDSLGCALLALNYPACQKILGPIVLGATLKNGAKVPGTNYELDPVQAAFNLGTMIRWLDYNDTWLAAEWGHPSDNIGGILLIADYLMRQGKQKFTVRDVLIAMIKAFEVQGVLSLENSFNQVGIDHVVLVKVATAAVVTHLLGGNKAKICDAVSLAFLDGHSLRTYRQAPNVGTRKSWAAGDATARGVFLALLVMRGEMGYPSVLTAKKWGLYDVYFKGKAFKFQRPYGSYVMENILFKIAFPGEYHGQTAIEAAIRLHPEIKKRIREVDDIERVTVRTQMPAMNIINKKGELHNPADRDHCLQYMIAVGLIFGEVTANSYEDTAARDSRIDTLRNKMEVIEESSFTRDYYDPDKRAFANAIQVFFRDGSHTDEILIEYPLGHRRRRAEGIPLLEKKFRENLLTRFNQATTEKIIAVFSEHEKLNKMPVNQFIDLFCEVKEK